MKYRPEIDGLRALAVLPPCPPAFSLPDSWEDGSILMNADQSNWA